MNPRKGTLGQGWSFPFGFDSANGQVALSSDEQNIRECISIILSTRPGERQMMPSFGCRIHELLFAPNTAGTATMVAHHVSEALTRWEPRIEVIDVRSFPESNGSLRVQVDYVINATNSRQSVSTNISNGSR